MNGSRNLQCLALVMETAFYQNIAFERLQHIESSTSSCAIV